VDSQRGGDARVRMTPALTDALARSSRLIVENLHQVSVAPDALAFLELIAAALIPQVVLSDFESDAKLERLGLRDRFARLHDCQGLGHWKPSPVPFAQVEAAHGVRPDEHLHVGDRLDTDGEGARRAGCRFLHLPADSKS
jgi:putative hydrolase of the HAD superfamily